MNINLAVCGVANVTDGSFQMTLANLSSAQKIPPDYNVGMWRVAEFFIKYINWIFIPLGAIVFALVGVGITVLIIGSFFNPDNFIFYGIAIVVAFLSKVAGLIVCATLVEKVNDWVRDKWLKDILEQRKSDDIEKFIANNPDKVLVCYDCKYVVESWMSTTNCLYCDGELKSPLNTST